VTGNWASSGQLVKPPGKRPRPEQGGTRLRVRRRAQKWAPTGTEAQLSSGQHLRRGRRRWAFQSTERPAASCSGANSCRTQALAFPITTENPEAIKQDTDKLNDINKQKLPRGENHSCPAEGSQILVELQAPGKWAGHRSESTGNEGSAPPGAVHGHSCPERRHGSHTGCVASPA